MAITPADALRLTRPGQQQLDGLYARVELWRDWLRKDQGTSHALPCWSRVVANGAVSLERKDGVNRRTVLDQFSHYSDSNFNRDFRIRAMLVVQIHIVDVEFFDRLFKLVPHELWVSADLVSLVEAKFRSDEEFFAKSSLFEPFSEHFLAVSLEESFKK